MNELYTIIYERLKDYLDEDVADHIKQDATYPYVQINGLDTVSNNPVDNNDYVATIDIISWSRYRGRSQVVEIMDNVYKALNKYDLDNYTVYGIARNYGISGIHQEFSKILVESDGLTRQGIQRFKLFFEEI